MFRRLQRIQQEVESERKRQQREDGSFLSDLLAGTIDAAVDHVVQNNNSTSQLKEHEDLTDYQRDKIEFDRIDSERMRRAWTSKDHTYTVDCPTLEKVKLPPKLSTFAYHLHIHIGPKIALSNVLKLAADNRIHRNDVRHLIKLGVLRSPDNPIDEQTYVRRIAAANRSIDAYNKRKEELAATRELCRQAGRQVRHRLDGREQRNEEKGIENEVAQRKKRFRQSLERDMVRLVTRELKHFHLQHDDVILTSKRDLYVPNQEPKQTLLESSFPQLPHPQKHLAWTSTLGHANDINGLKTALERPFNWTASNVKNGFFHLVITSVPGLEASDDQLVATAQRCMSRCGINTDAHAIQIYIHEDKPGHKHAHVIGNRIAVDGSYFAGHPTALVMACALERSIINKQHNFDLKLDPITPHSWEQRKIFKELCAGKLCSEYRSKSQKSRSIPITGTAAADRIREFDGIEFEVPVGLIKFQFLKGVNFDVLHYTS